MKCPLTSTTSEDCSEKFKKKCCSIYFRVCPNFKVDVCNMFGCPYALDKTRSRWNVVSDYLDDHFLGSGLFEIKYLCHWQTVWVSANSRLNLTWLSTAFVKCSLNSLCKYGFDSSGKGAILPLKQTSSLKKWISQVYYECTSNLNLIRVRHYIT